MGSFANTVFSILLGWMQSLISMIWSALTVRNENSFLHFIGKNWIIITVIICAAGLLADFVVYLFRWQPYKVWRSFWMRHKKGNLPEEEQTSYVSDPAVPNPGKGPAPEQKTTEDIPEPDAPEYYESNDLERWEEPEQPEEEIPPAEITRAGYTVPMDSPYRRPGSVYEQETDPENRLPDRNARRRRIRLSSFLGDSGEEDGFHYVAPKPIIDQKEAYHEPVYPNKWKNREGNEP